MARRWPVKWLFELNAKQRVVLARRFGLLGYESRDTEDVGREIGLYVRTCSSGFRL